MRKNGWFAAVALILVLGGCGGGGDDYGAAQAYLEGKYGGGFTPVDAGRDEGVYKFDRNGQACQVMMKDEGFQDNYQSLYYEAEVRRYFEEMARENVGADVLVQTDTRSSYLGAQAVLDCKNYLQECDQISIVIYTGASGRNKEAEMRKVCQYLKTIGISCAIRLYYVDPGYLYRLWQGEPFDENSEHVTAAGAASLAKDGEYAMSWSR